MIRIAIDAQLIGRPGGVGGYVASLLQALAEHDPDNEYVVYVPAGVRVPDALPADRFHVRESPLTRVRALRVLWQQRRLPRLLLRDAADLLHCPSYVVPLRAAPPVVLTLHDVIALKHPELCSRANALHYRRHLPAAVRKARLILASSETTRRDILETCDVAPERVRTVYPGLDPRFRPVPEPEARAGVRKALGLPDRFVLFVGNIEPKKDLETLIKAYAELADPLSGCSLVIAGAPLRGVRKLRRLVAAHGLNRRVRFTGFVPAEHLPALYSAAELFVFPSRYEGFGLPPVEAMACGTPVVCSDGGALPEVVGKAAKVFPAGDVAALVQAIRLVLTDETLRQRVIADGQARAAMLDWAGSVRLVLEAYRDAAAP